MPSTVDPKTRDEMLEHPSKAQSQILSTGPLKLTLVRFEHILKDLLYRMNFSSLLKTTLSNPWQNSTFRFSGTERSSNVLSLTLLDTEKPEILHFTSPDTNMESTTTLAETMGSAPKVRAHNPWLKYTLYRAPPLSMMRPGTMQSGYFSRKRSLSQTK